MGAGIEPALSRRGFAVGMIGEGTVFVLGVCGVLGSMSDSSDDCHAKCCPISLQFMNQSDALTRAEKNLRGNFKHGVSPVWRNRLRDAGAI